MEDFSIGASVRSGWETFKKRPWFFVGVTLIIALVSGIGSQMTDVQERVDAVADLGSIIALAAVFAVGMVIGVLIKMGTIAFLLKADDAVESVQVADLWAPHPFWKYVLSAVLTSILVLLGFILLIIPGIIVAIRLMFVSYLVMDKHMEITASLRESWRITRGYSWQLLGLALAIAGINVLGALCLIVGLLVSIPVSSLAFVHAYRTLQKKAGASPVIAA